MANIGLTISEEALEVLLHYDDLPTDEQLRAIIPLPVYNELNRAADYIEAIPEAAWSNWPQAERTYWENIAARARMLTRGSVYEDHVFRLIPDPEGTVQQGEIFRKK